MPVTLAELARRFGAEWRGDGETEVVGVAAFDSAGPGQIAYVSDPSYRQRLGESRAAVLILTATDAATYRGNALVAQNPQLCFAHIAAFMHPVARIGAGVHASALVDPNARVAATAGIGAGAVIEADAIIGDDVEIGPGCYIGRGAIIGTSTRLGGHVWIGERCVLGNNCLLQPGVVIGGDGFGYAKEGERWIKVPQLGRVVIGNDVEIGANSTVDRGALNDTEIGNGVKVDNLVQIAHNVRIGENTIIAACVGISGSTVIGRRCAFGGQVGVAGHLTIADDVQVFGTSLVAESITEAGTYSSAIRSEHAARWGRQVVRLKRLDETEKRLRRLEQEVQNLKGKSI